MAEDGVARGVPWREGGSASSMCCLLQESLERTPPAKRTFCALWMTCVGLSLPRLGQLAALVVYHEGLSVLTLIQKKLRPSSV